VDCSGTCRDTQTDEQACGGCGIVCDGADTCVAGTCTPPAECTAPPVVTEGMPAETGDTCVGGADIPLSCAGGGLSDDLVFAFTPTATDTYVIDTRGSDYDTALAVGSICGDDDLGCDDNIDGTDVDSELSVPLVSGTTYWIVVDGAASGNCGAFVLNIQATN
jgi:hypothetical protein